MIIALVCFAIPLVGLYKGAQLYPPAGRLLSKYPGIYMAAVIASAFALVFALRAAVIDPCMETTKWHTVTDHLGRFYQTAYKDSGEWCLWVKENLQ